MLYLQHEAKVKTMGVTVKEMESKKRILEEAVDGLNEEIAKLKATCKFFYYVLFALFSLVLLDILSWCSLHSYCANLS